MYILSIPDSNEVDAVDNFIEDKKHIFILVYMEGCGPCNATRPEWSKMSSALNHQYAKNNDVVIIDMNKDLLPSVKHIGSVEGFPTMKYITNNGNTIESYEDSAIKNKDRSSDSFINWVESKILKNKISENPMSSSQNVYKRIRKNNSNISTNRMKSRRKYKTKTYRRRKSIRKRSRQ